MSEKDKRELTKEIAEEIDVFDDMLTALVELLEEKGVLSHEEWEGRIKKKLKEASTLKGYRDAQFSES